MCQLYVQSTVRSSRQHKFTFKKATNCDIMCKNKNTYILATAVAIGAGLALTYATYSYFSSIKEKNDRYKGKSKFDHKL